MVLCTVLPGEVLLQCHHLLPAPLRRRPLPAPHTQMLFVLHQWIIILMALRRRRGCRGRGVNSWLLISLAVNPKSFRHTSVHFSIVFQFDHEFPCLEKTTAHSLSSPLSLQPHTLFLHISINCPPQLTGQEVENLLLLTFKQGCGTFF